MNCGGSFLSSLLITVAVALITYNAIVSFRVPLGPALAGPRAQYTAASISLDPVIRMPAHRRNGQRRLFHTAVTSSDSTYNTWQCRVMYYWFKKAQAAPASEMGGFTRILHSGRPDRFMDEIPTFVADPLPAGMDKVTTILGLKIK